VKLEDGMALGGRARIVEELGRLQQQTREQSPKRNLAHVGCENIS
jgi:hypothetical protein